MSLDDRVSAPLRRLNVLLGHLRPQPNDNPSLLAIVPLPATSAFRAWAETLRTDAGGDAANVLLAWERTLARQVQAQRHKHARPGTHVSHNAAAAAAAPAGALRAQRRVLNVLGHLRAWAYPPGSRSGAGGRYSLAGLPRLCD